MPQAGMKQAMIQLQNDLAQTRSQMTMMASSHDNLSRAHEALKAQSDALFRQRADEIKASEDKLSRLMFSQKFDLLDMKAMQPEMFKGRRNDAFKPWARKLKALLQYQTARLSQGARVGRVPERRDHGSLGHAVGARPRCQRQAS